MSRRDPRDAAAFALIAAGVVFRTWAVGRARFTGDESYFWATARNIATFEAAPVYGPALTGSGAYHPGPLFYYLMAFPQRLGASPWIGGVFVVLLHALSAWMLYRLAKEARGAGAGLIALALLAFAPWDVLYADRVWLSCVAPVWGATILYAAVAAPRSARWQCALVFFAGTCPQLHMSAPIVWLAVIVLLALGPKVAWSKRALLAGALGVFLAFLAPLIHELTHAFVNTRAILTEGGGKETFATLKLAPLRVFGYAVLYGSSEIGYHFNRGYWIPFDELAAYGTPEGRARWLALHGTLWAALGAFSIALSLAGWLVASALALRALRRETAVEHRVTLALLAGLAGATALIFVSKKGYFPHYTNLFMPIVLLPIACTLDRLPRWLAGAAVALSMAAMASSSVRYYRDVDALNGLSTTLSIVDDVMNGPMPVSVHFDGFQNDFAWQMLANVKYRRSLREEGNAPVSWQVKNASPWRGEVPPGAALHGPVLVTRTPPRQATR